MRSETIAEKRQREMDRMAKVGERKLKALATHPEHRASLRAIGASKR